MQSIPKAENFMRGAMLITAGAFVSRVLGAIYRPVAQLFIGDVGLGLVTPPSNAYQVILAVSSVGLNVAISRLVAQRLALDDYRGARRVFQVATGVLVVSGIVFSVVLAFGARWLAEVYKLPESWVGFLVLSPAILLVTLECTFRGLYQGMQQMRPSAVSQVVEQAGRVGAGLLLMALLAPVAVNYGAAGFNAGSSVGALLGVLYGGWIYFSQRPTATWTHGLSSANSYETESVRSLLGKIMAIAIPLSILGAVLPIIGMADGLILGPRLESIGITGEEYSRALAYLANASTLRDLPSILTTALYVSLVPAITESMATNRLDQAQQRAATAFRVTLAMGLPATVGLFVGAQDAYQVLFSGPGFLVLAPLAWSTLFLMVQQTSSGVLQGMGQIWVSVRNVLVGIAVKTLLTYWWAGLPSLKVVGAAYATVVGFALAAALNLLSLRRTLGVGIALKDDVGRPALASAAMGAVIWVASPVAHHLLPGHRLPGLATVALGGLVYMVAIFLVGGVKESDLYLVPGFRSSWIDRLRQHNLLRD